MICDCLKYGLFCLNKDKHITSAKTLEIVKKILAKKTTSRIKVGHGGTIDSAATGVLVVGTEKGCKKLTQFLHGTKRYVVTGKFGEATDTYNDEGKIIRLGNICLITRTSIASMINRYIGKILQVPPPYCALKARGRRMSDIIKEGEKVVLLPRQVECISIDLLDFSLPFVTLEIHCGGGFYVRSLIHDLGIALNSCAHVTNLCRIQQGPFTLQDCINCDDLSFENITSSIYRLQTMYKTCC